MRECLVEECSRQHYGLGFCSMHYQRAKSGRDLSAPPSYLREVTWSGVHQRLEALWGSASQYPCVSCAGQAKEWAYDGTDRMQKVGHAGHRNRVRACFFSSWPEFYMPLCRRCHRARDAAAAKQELREYREWKMRNPGKTLKDLEAS